MSIELPGSGPLTVLVPDEIGMAAISRYPRLRGVRYDAAEPPTAEHHEGDVIVVGLGDGEPTLRFLLQLPGLRLVQALSAGVEQWAGRLPAGVALANASGGHGGSVAEWVAATLLSHYRELPTFALDQSQQLWRPHATDSLRDKNVAVLGAGDVARTTAAVLRPFGCTVTLFSRRERDDVRSLGDFAACRGDYDVVVLALPDAPSTRHIVDTELLAGLRDGCVLVNAGRGALVDTDALTSELSRGRISAILDVTDPEPLPSDHPLWHQPGVTITPHVAGAVPGVWERAWGVVLTNLDEWAAGGDLKNVVDQD